MSDLRLPSHLPDAALAERILAQGDDAAFRVMYRRHTPALCGVLRPCRFGCSPRDIVAFHTTAAQKEARCMEDDRALNKVSSAATLGCIKVPA